MYMYDICTNLTYNDGKNIKYNFSLFKYVY